MTSSTLLDRFFLENCAMEGNMIVRGVLEYICSPFKLNDLAALNYFD